MASIQKKGDAWYCQFLYGDKRHSLTIGKVSEREAARWKANAENLLQLLRQGRLEIPRGVTVGDFILHDGKPPLDPDVAPRKDTTLAELRKGYVETHSAGAIEKNTLYVAGIHLDHIAETLGVRFLLTGLTLAKLQAHVNRRQATVQPVTIKKEIDTFRSVWNWGLRMKWVDQPFPSGGLVYAKSDEKLPFMTWEEIERRIKAGGDPDQLWETLYLTPAEIAELLDFVKARRRPAWNYPMLVMAAHTGARKSEMIRARVEDVDLAAGVIQLREKKRAKGVRTTRSVPISPALAAALTPQLERQKGQAYLFGSGVKPLTVQAVHHAIERALEKSKWSVVRGWHVLRHSFVSACANKGIDQRLIDEWVGHQTEIQKRRYRHLYPSVQRSALHSVFS